MKLWNESKKMDPTAERFTVGEDYLFDQELIPYECMATAAYAEMLQRLGLLTEEELRAILRALDQLSQLHETGTFHIRPEQEDCHTAVEEFLTEQLGDAGKKIHTGRSRNDQIQTVLRLYYRDHLQELEQKLLHWEKALDRFIQQYGSIRFPGYTHTRPAMPSSFAIWAGAFRDSSKDNRAMIQAVQNLLDQCPLGTGAGYGVPLPLDRVFLARKLGFGRVQENPLYVQNSRGKFETFILHLLSMIQLDVNRFATDVIFFSMPETGFLELSPRICTGSSIMPHKKNPDVFEILRGMSHSAMADQLHLWSLISNLISGYHRDFQLIKPILFRQFRQTKEMLSVAIHVLPSIQVNKSRCQAALTDDLFSVHRVLERVRAGVPFRDAYREEARRWQQKDTDQNTGPDS